MAFANDSMGQYRGSRTVLSSERISTSRCERFFPREDDLRFLHREPAKKDHHKYPPRSLTSRFPFGFLFLFLNRPWNLEWDFHFSFLIFRSVTRNTIGETTKLYKGLENKKRDGVPQIGGKMKEKKYRARFIKGISSTADSVRIFFIFQLRRKILTPCTR